MADRKAKWHPCYYSKRDIIAMDDYRLLEVFEGSIADETIAHNHLANGVPMKLLKQIEWIREELITRLGK